MKDTDKAIKPQVVDPAVEERLKFVRYAAHLLDSAIQIPGTNYRIGLDGLFGLLPGLGDAIGTTVSMVLIYWAARLGAPPRAIVRMVGNVALESVVGIVPIFGDLFDFAWKANQRNITLLEHSLADPEIAPRSEREVRSLFLVIVGVGLLLCLLGIVLFFAGIIKLAALLAG